MNPQSGPSCLGIIPARYASSRLPGKALIDIDGKTMIRRVWEQVSNALDRIIVATDDDRIYKEVLEFGGYPIKTDPQHLSGTDRCAEALSIYKRDSGFSPEVVINIQGDEPYIDPEEIERLCLAFNEPDIQLATLIIKCYEKREVFDPNLPKVVTDTKGNAMYFSRNPIPFVRNKIEADWQPNQFFRHIGMYGYRSKTLLELSCLKRSKLEEAEALEQLRWLESGYSIKTIETHKEAWSIDTIEDLEQGKKMGLIASYTLPGTKDKRS